MTLPTYIELTERDPTEVTPSLFRQLSQSRVLFIDKLQPGEPYLLFRVNPKGHSFRPHSYSDVEHLASVETLIAAIRGINAVSFSNYLVFTYELYGKEWYVLKVI